MARATKKNPTVKYFSSLKGEPWIESNLSGYDAAVKDAKATAEDNSYPGDPAVDIIVYKAVPVAVVKVKTEATVTKIAGA